MLLSLDSGVSALEQFQQQLNVIANNIANVNTVGFKSADVNFADTLSQTLGSNAAGSMQVGTGVMMSSITNDFSAGTLTSTGNQSNMAISGNGFFLVKDPTSGNSYVTRDGSFTLDNGYLVTSNGMRVQGYSDSGLSTVGDIKIDNNGNTAEMLRYTIGDDGTISVLLAGTPSTPSTTITRGQILLDNVANPNQLLKVGNNLYSGLTAAGASTTPVAPKTSGMGSIATSSLEMSNVDLAQQLTSLISVQSAYQANSKVITTSDNVLQTLVNLVR